MTNPPPLPYPEDRMRELPNYNLDEFKRILGLEHDLSDPPLTYRQKTTVRVVTDAAQCRNVKAAIDSASHWLEKAYQEGVAAGLESERRAWELKLCGLFGIRRDRHD